MMYARVEEAKTKNKTFQLFDKMLGLEKDPKLLKIREQNPLNNILVPKDGINDLDERIDQFYEPMDPGSGESLHPLLQVHKGLSLDSKLNNSTFNYTQLSANQYKENGSPACSHRSKKSLASGQS